MLRSGARWRDCSAVYGPYTTVYNRFNRWSRQGIWYEIFYALTGSTGIFPAPEHPSLGIARVDLDKLAAMLTGR